MSAKQAQPVQAAAPATPDRKAVRASAIEGLGQVRAAIASLGEDEHLDSAMVDSAVESAIVAFSPKGRAPGAPRVTLAKASPADVASFFASTGLTRKELANAAAVSTSVIATVQNEKGDRWSVITFEAKRALILTWMTAHAAEIEARKANEAAEAVARQAAIDAKAARKAAASAPKVAKAKAPAAATKATAKAAATKPGRPSAAARQANRKARPQLSVAGAQAQA